MLPKFKPLPNANSSQDEVLYSLAMSEVANGYVLPGLWTKAQAHGDFNEDKMAGYYVRERVKQLEPYLKEIAQFLAAQAIEQEVTAEVDKKMSTLGVANREKELRELEGKRDSIRAKASSQARDAQADWIKRRKPLALAGTVLGAIALYFGTSVLDPETFQNNAESTVATAILMLALATIISGTFFFSGAGNVHTAAYGKVSSEHDLSSLEQRIQVLGGKNEQAGALQNQLIAKLAEVQNTTKRLAQIIQGLFPYDVDLLSDVLSSR